MVAHAGFNYGGHIWELVGPLASLPLEAGEPVPAAWSDEECAPSHALPATLAALATLAARDDYLSPLLVGVGVAHHAPCTPGCELQPHTDSSITDWRLIQYL